MGSAVHNEQRDIFLSQLHGRFGSQIRRRWFHGQVVRNRGVLRWRRRGISQDTGMEDTRGDRLLLV